MKRVNLFLFLFLSPMLVFGQLKVQSNGDTYASMNIFIGNSSNFLGTSTNVPVVFKVNNIFAGSTGSTLNRNVSFGYEALLNPSVPTGGDCNSAYGFRSLYSNTTGANNIAFGAWALYNNTIVSFNTAVGYIAGQTNANNLINATAIGYWALNTANQQVRIGNSTVISIGGYVSWSNISDGRVKKNIRTEVPGLAFINLLQPVTYNLDLDAIDKIQKSDDPSINRFTDSLHLARSPEEKEIEAKARENKEKLVYSGFIAQDVEKAAQSVGYDFSGVDAPENERSPYGLRYSDFVVPLVKAVQELSEHNIKLQEQNNRMQEQINEFTAKLNELINAVKSQNAMVNSESESAKNFSFTIYPNPTSGFFTIEYSLIIDAQICIEMYNMFGKREKLILPKQNKKAGTYSVQISVSDLGSGTYFVKASSGIQSESKQLVVNH